ncbi:TonB-dependent receptor [Marinifilum fragile]|uniref:TonB-dependent receptor n=1 Tax=Marinifilum fragile TaxID=570161 RepID=UPI0006D0866D|nr:TonB-dependent receptor [Marinifilum fragile]
MYRILLSIFFILTGLSLFAQKSYTLTGKVLDSQEEGSLPGATILLINKSDTIQKTGTITDESGNFNIKVKPGQYDFQVSFIGYKDIKKSITVDKISIDLGQFKLIENSEFLQEINITETLPPTKIKGDTTVFNPNAFKVNPDATAGELLAKMPGFYEVAGKLVVEGQEVAEILVDGKKFFGNNMNQALATIPNDVIKNIEVYEYKSDEEKFTGLKRNEEDKKTLNIVTTKKSKRLVFGDVAAGFGKDNRYGFDGNFNSFSDNNSITLTAKSRDVNAPLKLSNRNFGNRSIDGNDIQDDSFGINFVNSKNENDIEFSYEYGNQDYENKSSSVRNYTSDALLGQIQNSTNHSTNDNNDHRINLRVSLNSNPKHRLMLNTNISTADRESNSNSISDTKLNGNPLNSNNNHNSSENKNYNLYQTVNYSKRLGNQGRSLNLNAGFNYSNNKSDGTQLSETLNESNEVSQSINRISDSKRKNTGVNAGISYSEPIGKKGFANLGYRFNYNEQKSDKYGYNFNENENSYSDLDELTTNNFENSSIINAGRFSYNLNGKTHGFSLGADFEMTTLKNEESFPNQTDFKKDFFSFKPYVRYSLNLKNQKRINLNYMSRTTTPNIRDLQEVVDLSNPLYISTGNSELEQSSSHTLMALYSASNMKKGSHLSIHAMATSTNNTVGRRTIVAAKDTTINGLYFLPAGGQFSEPVNLDGQYSIGTSISYSFPLKKLKSKLNINTRGRFSHNPTFVNDKKAYTDSWNLNHGMTLSSNISEKIDFTFTSSSNYQKSNNTSNSGSEYLSQTTSLNMYWNFYKDLVFRTNASNNYQNNFSTNDVDNFWHLNLGLSTKVFKSKRGELSFTAYDILSKDDQRSHFVSDLYTADYYTNKLNKFYILTFSYKLRDGKEKGRKHRGGHGMYPSYGNYNMM